MGLFDSNMDLPKPEEEILSPEEIAVLDKLAKKCVKWGMSIPGILMLESTKPLNYIGSQTLVFFEPIVQTIFNFKEYDTFRLALEKRETMEILIRKIEQLDAVARDREKRIKRFMKQEKKKWKWYQRYLGVFPPKVQIPEEVLEVPKKENNDSDNNQSPTSES